MKKIILLALVLSSTACVTTIPNSQKSAEYILAHAEFSKNEFSGATRANVANVGQTAPSNTSYCYPDRSFRAIHFKDGEKALTFRIIIDTGRLIGWSFWTGLQDDSGNYFRFFSKNNKVTDYGTTEDMTIIFPRKYLEQVSKREKATKYRLYGRNQTYDFMIFPNEVRGFLMAADRI